MQRHSLQCSNIQLLHQQPTYLGSLSERQAFMHLIKYVAFRLSYSPYKKGCLIVTCLYGLAMPVCRLVGPPFFGLDSKTVGWIVMKFCWFV